MLAPIIKTTLLLITYSFEAIRGVDRFQVRQIRRFVQYIRGPPHHQEKTVTRLQSSRNVPRENRRRQWCRLAADETQRETRSRKARRRYWGWRQQQHQTISTIATTAPIACIASSHTAQVGTVNEWIQQQLFRWFIKI